LTARNRDRQSYRGNVNQHVKTIADLIRTLDVNFEQALHILDALTQIHSRENNFNRFEERWDSIIADIESEDWVKEMVTYDMYMELRTNHGRTTGTEFRLDRAKPFLTDIYPSNLKVPICSVCILLTYQPN
jgi:hypothetical protein